MQQEVNLINPDEHVEIPSDNRPSSDNIEPCLNESNAFSRVTQPMKNADSVIKMFQQYEPQNKAFQMSQLHSSPNLKLKKYRQSIYYGQFLEGKRQGIGIMLYDNGRVYEGQWDSDFKQGPGYEKFPNGCSYEGQYFNGKPHGVGRYVWKNGEVYDGEWKDGLKHGSGMWQGKSGDSYIGEWKQGKAEGYGVHTWINGDRYEGEFRECLKHGQGIQKFANGDIYKGLYANGKPSGFGQYYWANGSYFKGNFKNGLRDGHGTWKKGPGNSDKYQGEYSNDKKCGYGIFTWASGNVYKGNYDSDQRHGYGEMYWNDGSLYKGNWHKGIQHGKGQMYSPEQGFKKGLFEDNVLVAIDDDSQAYNPRKTGGTLIRDATHPPPSEKLHFRTRAYSGKYRSRDAKSQNDYSSIVSEGPNAKQYNPVINNRFTRSKPKVLGHLGNRTIEEKKTRQKILHSSFYLHKLHNKGAKPNPSYNKMNFEDSREIQNQQAQQNDRVHPRSKIRSVHGHRQY